MRLRFLHIKDKWVYVVIVALAAVVWGVNFYFFVRLPEFRAPIPGSDTALYWYIAKLIKADGVVLRQFHSYFFSPVYAILFYLFSLIGNSVSVASVFSGVCFVLSSLLIYYLAKRLFDKKVAFLTSMIFILYKPVIFYSLLPIKTMFFIAALLLFLVVYQLMLEKDKIVFAISGGFLAGVLLLTEGLFLPLLVVLLLYLCFKAAVKSRCLYFVVGIIVALMPVSIRNYAVSGAISPFSPVGGIHFFIGNNENATPFYRPVGGIRPNAFGHYFDALRVAENKLKKHLTDREANSFWLKEGLSFIMHHPDRFMRLYLKKILLSINNFEPPNNFLIYALEKYIPPLKKDFIDFSIVFALSLAGIVFFVAKYGKINFLMILALLYPFIVSLFFITSRYRIILPIFLMPFAAYFVFDMLNVIKERRFGLVALGLVVVITSFYVSRINLTKNIKGVFLMSYFRREYYTQGLANLEVKVKNAHNLKKKKYYLLREAGLLYRSGMEEIGDYLRNKAYSLHKTE